jgi:DNA-binding CsgD family transcriptional regulator
VIYHSPSFQGYSIHNPFLLLTYKEDWVARYKDENYLNIDPVFKFGAKSLLPIDWSKLPRQGRKVQKLFGEASEFGVGNQGLTIPVRGPTNGLWALFTVTAEETNREWRARYRPLVRDLVHVAQYMHLRAYEMHKKEDIVDLNAITRREIEALQWSADGKSVIDIAILMGISRETVKAHLDVARDKLSALNRTHAVAKAIRSGLIR